MVSGAVLRLSGGGGCTCRVSRLFIKGFVMHSCGLSALNVGFRGGIHRGWCDRSS